MVTWGFVGAYSGVVTLDSYFRSDLPNFTSIYIIVGAGGNLVWENALKQVQYLENVAAGQYAIGAGRILSSGVVNGVTRVTTATGLNWIGSPNAA